MKSKTKVLLVFIAISAVAFVLAFTVPTTEYMKGIIASPGVLGLLAVLLQLMRDESVHVRNKEIQAASQSFGLGATSHMANRVFDKHVEFCEKYLAEVHVIADILFREGPTEKAVNLGNGLYRLKLEYAAWLTDEISDSLFPFEQALRELGSKKGFIDSTVNVEAYAKARQKRIPQIHEDYLKILHLDTSKDSDPNVSVESVIRTARSILDMDELVWLRKKIIIQARESLKI
jgi:hypothetical protein